jgi:hypothetical protein
VTVIGDVMKRVIGVVALASLAIIPRAVETAATTPTIDAFLGPAYPQDVVSAKKADRIAWWTYERGLRNVFTAAAPDFKPVALTHFRDDSGIESAISKSRTTAMSLPSCAGRSRTVKGGSRIRPATRAAPTGPSGRHSPAAAECGALVRARLRHWRPTVVQWCSPRTGKFINTQSVNHRPALRKKPGCSG